MKGVFVSVTMAVSTVSVIESIIVMRLCSLQDTTMPEVVRFVAFNVLGRVLFITRSSPKPQEDRESNIERQLDSNVQEPLLGDPPQSLDITNSSELVDKINDVLSELKKITDRQKKKNGMETETVNEWHDVGNTESLVHSDVQEPPLGDTSSPIVVYNSSELVNKINDVLVELRKITARQEKDDMEEETNEEWRDLGNVLDRLLFFISLIVLLWVIVWMAIKSTQGRCDAASAHRAAAADPAVRSELRPHTSIRHRDHA